MKKETKQGLAVIGTVAGIAGGIYAASRVKAAPPCTPGETKCIGFDLYQCVENEWALLETNSLQCGWVPVPTELLVELSLVPETEPVSLGVIYVGEMMRITAKVTNIGSNAAMPALALYVNSTQLGSSWQESLAPGKSFSHTWHFNPPEVGTYTINAVADGFEATDSFEAIEAPPGVPDISIGLIVEDDLRCTPAFTYCWITLDAIIRNNGDGGGNWSVEWYVNGALYCSRAGYLAAGAHDFADAPPYNPSAYGTYHIDIIFDWDGHHEEYHRECVVHQY